jgi:PAS domain S-box-containing protein
LLAYNRGRESLRSATISELQATALEKEAALNTWIDEKQTDIVTLASDPAIVEDTDLLIAASPDSPASRELHDSLIANIQPHMAGNEFLEISLLHPETGQVMASTDPREEGKFKEDHPYFINGRKGPYVQNFYFSPSTQAIAMTVSSPLYTDDKQLVGVLAARLNLDGLNAIIQRRTGLHESDEAYLVDRSSLFASQPRFISDPAVLRREIHTQDLDNCLQQESGVIEANDYRGVPAFVVYHWLPKQKMCLVVKMDQSEAYSPIRRFGGTIAAISAIALLIAAALAFILARSMTRPILALQNGVTRLAEGELDLLLPETSKDELGQLATEFNKMAMALSEQQTLIRRRAEQFFNLSLDLLCMINPSGRLLDLNPAWERTLGYRREELRGQLFTNLVHPDDLANVMSAFPRVTRDAVGRFEIRCRHLDGQYRWLAWVVVASTQDQLLYAAARDITERRLREEMLHQQTEELERSNRDLEQFAHVVSNDLQEPLRTVSHYLHLLDRRYHGRFQDADEFIGSALDGARQMKTLLSGLLAYSEVGLRNRDLSPILLDEVFGRVMQSLFLVSQESGAVITHDPLPQVLGDESQLAQLLENLIGNALKFHGAEPPRIHIGVRQTGEQWLFFVRDHGIGIDPQYMDRVFVIFQRFHNRTEFPGIGVGLALCRRIVERHGGRIWVDSETGKGTTFYFTLQPAVSGVPQKLPADVVKRRSKDTVIDRATDLI